MADSFRNGSRHFAPDDGEKKPHSHRRRRPGAAPQASTKPHSKKTAATKPHRPQEAHTKDLNAATITATQDAAALSSQTFGDLGLPHDIVRILSDHNIVHPFPIQAATIPDVLAGKDVLGRGPTGSGKTFSFGLPMLATLAKRGVSKPGHPRALVLEPTRELAAQVRQRLEEPAAALGLRVLEVVGGVNINKNFTSLARPVDLLVATPGRAQDLLNQKKLFFDSVEITAIDEADQMADMGFLPQVTKLLHLTPSDGQRLLFSATLDGQVQTLVDRFLLNPVTHSTAPVGGNVETMTHYVFFVGDRDNRTAITQWIGSREGKTIMFMRTRHGVDRQVKKLRRVGVNALGLHGDKGQSTRENTLLGFTDGSCPVLVATDIAARGIDIAGVDLVVHVDPPAEHKAYLHRAGRTARAGDQGTVVTLVTDEQKNDVAQLMKKADVNPKTVDISSPTLPILATITGARKPSGKRLDPAGGKKPRPSGKKRNPRDGSGSVTAARGRGRVNGSRRGRSGTR